MKLSKKQIIIILVGISVGMSAGVVESISHEYFKPNLDIVGSNQTVVSKAGIVIMSNECNGLLFKNSTGDKICATWDDLHDGILHIKNMKHEVVVTINNTEVKPQLPTIHMNQTGVDISPDIVSGNYVTFDDGCKTAFDYNKVTLEDTREYLVSGNCTNADMPMLENYVKQFLIEKSKELTSNSAPSSPYNPPEIDMSIPIDSPKESTDDTQCSGITWQVCEQNKKIINQEREILNNQNIQLCLEVVKNPNNWVEIGKYLTQRGVNCTGLDIKGLQ